MAETVALTCLTVVKEAVGELSPEACLRPLQPTLSWPPQCEHRDPLWPDRCRGVDGARLAVGTPRRISSAGLKRVFEPGDLKSQVKAITSGASAGHMRLGISSRAYPWAGGMRGPRHP